MEHKDNILKVSEHDQRREVHLLKLGEPPPMHRVGFSRWNASSTGMGLDPSLPRKSLSADISVEDDFFW